MTNTTRLTCDCGCGLDGSDLAYGLVCPLCETRVAGQFADMDDVPDYVPCETAEAVDAARAARSERIPRPAGDAETTDWDRDVAALERDPRTAGSGPRPRWLVERVIADAKLAGTW